MLVKRQDSNLFGDFVKMELMMKKQKMKQTQKDTLQGREFTKIFAPRQERHLNFRREGIPDDENLDQYKEILIGMEHDIESRESLEADRESENTWPDEDLLYLLSTKSP